MQFKQYLLYQMSRTSEKTFLARAMRFLPWKNHMELVTCSHYKPKFNKKRKKHD